MRNEELVHLIALWWWTMGIFRNWSVSQRCI